MKIIAGVLLAIVIIVAVNAVLQTNQQPKLKVLDGGDIYKGASRGGADAAAAATKASKDLIGRFA